MAQYYLNQLTLILTQLILSQQPDKVLSLRSAEDADVKLVQCLR